MIREIRLGIAPPLFLLGTYLPYSVTTLENRKLLLGTYSSPFYLVLVTTSDAAWPFIYSEEWRPSTCTVRTSLDSSILPTQCIVQDGEIWGYYHTDVFKTTNVRYAQICLVTIKYNSFLHLFSASFKTQLPPQVIQYEKKTLP